MRRISRRNCITDTTTHPAEDRTPTHGPSRAHQHRTDERAARRRAGPMRLLVRHRLGIERAVSGLARSSRAADAAQELRLRSGRLGRRGVRQDGALSRDGRRPARRVRGHRPELERDGGDRGTGRRPPVPAARHRAVAGDRRIVGARPRFGFMRLETQSNNVAACSTYARSASCWRTRSSAVRGRRERRRSGAVLVQGPARRQTARIRTVDPESVRPVR